MKLLVVLMTALFTGCASQSNSMLADATTAAEDVAVVVTKQEYPEQQSSLKLTKIDGVAVASSDINKGEVKLKPGRYLLTYYVMNSRSDAGWKYAYVEAPKRVQAGQSYVPKVKIFESSAEVWLDNK